MIFILQIIRHMRDVLAYEYPEIEEHLKSINSETDLDSVCYIMGLETPKEFLRPSIINICGSSIKLKAALNASRLKEESQNEDLIA